MPPAAEGLSSAIAVTHRAKSRRAARPDIDDLALAPGWQNELLHHGADVLAGVHGLLGDVLGEVALDEVGNGWGGPALVALVERVRPAVDLALQPPRLVPRGRDRSGGMITDRIAAAPRLNA